MAKPVVVIRSQSRVNKTITITGYVIGSPTSITASLPASAVPNGAISQPASAVVMDPDGEFTKTFSALPYGDYDPASFTATNAEGSHTVTTMPMRLFVPGAAPVGTPRVLFPGFVAPVFTAAKVALGSAVTNITFESDSPTGQSNIPFTFGQPFKEGDLAPGDFLVGRIAGQADVPLQFNAKSTHPDGSVRHAVISGVLPALAAGAQKVMALVRSATGASTGALASNLATNAEFSAAVNITASDGVAYTADATPVLAAGIASAKAWLSGAITNEHSINLPFKDAGGFEHPHLMAQFNVRYFPGARAAKVDITVEHTKGYAATADVSYTGEVRVGGAAVMSIAGAAGALVHFPTARWKRTFWWGHTNPVHIKHNVPYFIATKQVPNYDQSVTIPESVLASYATETGIKDPNFALMGRGLVGAVFGAQGGRPELGMQPSWYAAALLSQDKRAKKLMLAIAECAGSWNNTHRRDDSNGPFHGQPLDVIHFPGATLLGTSADSKNGATGLAEKLPALTTASKLQPDASHQPNFSYLPYLVTGDLFYLEELHFWVNFNLYASNPGYRDGANGLLYPDQPRGQAWSTRTLAEAAVITPDNHPAKQQFAFWMANNLAWYNKNFTDNPAANKLGIMTQGAIVYRNGEPSPKSRIGNFQDDFVTQNFNHARELGFKAAARFVMWKAKWQVERIIGKGSCWIDTCYYDPRIRPLDGSAIFTTIEEVWANTLSATARALPCNSYERYAQIETDEGRTPSTTKWKQGAIGGYPDWGMGFAANYQPALAAAVDIGYPGADDAWLVYSNRAVKQNWGVDPQFAVVPRGYTADVPVDPTPIDPPPTDPTGPTDPTDPPPTDPTDPPTTDPDIMAIADSVKDSTTTTGTGDITLAGSPQINFQTWAPAIPIGERSPYTIRHRTLNERESGFGHLVSEFVFARDEVTSSTNNGLKVQFSAGIKDISNDLTAALFNELAGKHNATATTLSATSSEILLMCEVDGALQKIPLDEAGQTSAELPLLPGTTVLDTDEIQVLRGGTDYRAPRSYFGSSAPVDGTAPQFLSGQVSNATPTVILLTFGETLGSYTPAASAFSVSGGKTVTAVARNGASLSLTVSAAYVYGDVISVTYTKPTTNPIQDAAGNQTANFGPAGVVNNIAAPGDGVVPTVNTAAVANATPTIVVLTASEPLDAAFVPAATAFAVGGHTVSSVTISGSTISLATTPAFVNGEAARTAAYTQPGTNNARDLAGNLMANFSGLAITNNVAAGATAPGAPLIGTAVAGDGYVDVNFSAPASNGGAAIDSYKATLSTGESNTGASPIRVLAANGAARTATVQAHNSVGYGPASAASNSVTPTAVVVAALTADTPATTQQAGVNFTLAGAYSGTVPTALDYSWDGGTTWYQPITAATIDTTAQTWSMSVWMQNQNAAQTVKVRKRNETATIATTGAFTVTAPKAYTITGYDAADGLGPNTVKATYDATALATSGGGFKQITDACTGGYWHVKSGGVDAPGVKAGWGTSKTIPPNEITSAQNAPGGLNGMQTAPKTGANVFPNGGRLWAQADVAPREYSLWLRPTDSVAVCVGTVLVTVQ